ncbi:MAG TPA: hypothetical protein VIT23_15360, partial [Terrimicrobiaceae bacterium]
TFPVQIRFAYTLLLISCQLPLLERLYWVPTVGAFALVFFGYCLMARMLSLLPWNRTEAMSLDLVWRTFFTPPLPGISITASPRSECGGEVRSGGSHRVSVTAAQGPRIQSKNTTKP